MKPTQTHTPGPLAALRHHVTGAIERGEKAAIAGVPAEQPNRIWVGVKPGGKREPFRFRGEPTPCRLPMYVACIGPFRTMRGARFMVEHGRGNPHCQCVRDAENLAAGRKYDTALRRWVSSRAKGKATQ